MEGVFTFIGALTMGNHMALVIGHLLLVAVIVLWFGYKATSNLKAVPDRTQNVMEAYLGGVIAMGTDVIGEELSRRYLPLVATIGLFVLVSNLVGIIPGFESPTSNINVTLT